MRILLHACCGPCSLESTRLLREDGHELAISYENPNIHPAAEYELRRDTLVDYVARPQGLEVHEGNYDPKTWEKVAGIYGADKERRCRACYRLRLERTAQRAADLGFEAISTTLTISPYQYTSTIFEELRAAAAHHGLEAVCRDFRPAYPETTRRSRELGMYRQNYCGCRFSIVEAQREREQRKEEHEMAKAIKHRALLYAAAAGSVGQPNQL